MNRLTKDKVVSQSQRRGWPRAKRACQNCENKYGADANLLIAIYTIESFYRPFRLRACEYFVVFLSCVRCLLWGTPIKNYTIGTCQLGLATIFNFYGGNVYQHAHTVTITTFSELKQIFTVLSTDRSIEILAFSLHPITHKANRIYPYKFGNQIRYIGEQYNGRYSYGLMLTEVYQQLERVA